MALVNLAEYEAKAREILPLPVFDYYYGGAHDERSRRCARRRLHPTRHGHREGARARRAPPCSSDARYCGASWWTVWCDLSAVLGILSDELDLAMALCGCRSLAEITADLVRS